MMRYEVRFHLGKGENHGKWQVKCMAGVQYYDPATVSLTLLDCQLRNHPATARKIFDGANKKVCAWVDCNELLVEGPEPKAGIPVSYNPRVAPYWRNFCGQKVDGTRVEVLRSDGRQLVATGERTEVVGGLVRLAPPAAEEHKVWGGGR